MIPDEPREKIIAALEQFDINIRNTPKWMHWHNNKKQLWAIKYNEKIYPPKKIISIATGIHVNSFHGGTPSNTYLEKRGFTIMPINDETNSIQDSLESIMAEYIATKQANSFSKHNNIGKLFTKINSSLSNIGIVKTEVSRKCFMPPSLITWLQTN